MRSAETELQNTKELRATASEILAPKPDGSRRQSKKKTILKHFLKGFFRGKSLAPKWRKSADKSLSQPSCSHSNTIYEVLLHITHAAKAGSNLDAATTIQRLSCKPQSHLDCGNDPTVAKQNGIPSATNSTLAIPFTLRERSYSFIHQRHLQSHLHCGNDPTVANQNGILSTGHARRTGESPFTMRNRSEHDPTTHETVSQPSHRRGRSSRFGDGLCMEKHRVSCICYLSKTHFVRDLLQNSIGNFSTSTTCNAICIKGTILQLQITMEFHRQLIHQRHLQSHLHCGNDPTVANQNGILSTGHARRTGESPFTMRNRSEHDPTTHETVSQPSHRRGRSSRFGDGLCMEKHRVSCICYLSKTHFVRDLLQNSIGNSSTSTACNAILILSLTNSFPDILKVTSKSVPN